MKTLSKALRLLLEDSLVEVLLQTLKIASKHLAKNTICLFQRSCCFGNRCWYIHTRNPYARPRLLPKAPCRSTSTTTPTRCSAFNVDCRFHKRNHHFSTLRPRYFSGLACSHWTIRPLYSINYLLIYSAIYSIYNFVPSSGFSAAVTTKQQHFA